MSRISTLWMPFGGLSATRPKTPWSSSSKFPRTRGNDLKATRLTFKCFCANAVGYEKGHVPGLIVQSCHHVQWGERQTPEQEKKGFHRIQCPFTDTYVFLFSAKSIPLFSVYMKSEKTNIGFCAFNGAKFNVNRSELWVSILGSALSPGQRAR